MKPVWVILILLGTLLLLLFIAIFAVLRVACRRGKPLGVDIEKQLAHSAFRQFTPMIIEARSWLERMPHELVSTQSFDGLRLAARYVPCENARGTILLFHGWRSYPEVDFGAAFAFYHGQGLNLLLVDQRAQGSSQGHYITFGIRERRDVATWVTWHNAHFGADIPLLISGLSMGATTVLMAAGNPLAANVRGVIADCGFTSPAGIIGKLARENHIPAAPVLFLLNLETRLFAGFGLKEYSTLTALQQTTLPVFFAHGEADTFVPCEMTKRNYAACASKDKTLLLVPGAGHGQSYLIQPEQYRAMVCAFLERTLGASKTNS